MDNVESPNLSGQEDGQAREEEARAVARAIGLPTALSEGVDFRRASSSDLSEGDKAVGTRGDATSGAESPSLTGPPSPDGRTFTKWRSQNWQDPKDADLESTAESSAEK